MGCPCLCAKTGIRLGRRWRRDDGSTHGQGTEPVACLCIATQAEDLEPEALIEGQGPRVAVEDPQHRLRATPRARPTLQALDEPTADARPSHIRGDPHAEEQERRRAAVTPADEPQDPVTLLGEHPGTLVTTAGSPGRSVPLDEPGGGGFRCRLAEGLRGVLQAAQAQLAQQGSFARTDATDEEGGLAIAHPWNGSSPLTSPRPAPDGRPGGYSTGAPASANARKPPASMMSVKPAWLIFSAASALRLPERQ